MKQPSDLVEMTLRSCVVILLSLAAAPDAVSSQMLLTSGSNVRLRAAPDTDAAIVAMLPLGAELHRADSIQQDGWIRVRAVNGEEGWIDERFVTPVSNDTYRTVVRELIASRLEREGDSFLARTELLNLIEAVLRREWSHEERAELELQRFNALTHALRMIPFTRARWDADLIAWVSSREDEIRYNEPGGHWLILRDVILDRHSTYRSTAAADELAWFAVLNGLPGECEGDLVCFLEWHDRLEGEYLRRQPTGKQVDEAARRLRWVVEYYRESSRPSKIIDPQRECPALRAAVASLASALLGSTASDRATHVRDLQAMLTLCP